MNEAAKPWRPARDLALLMAAALACAWVSNRFADPTRRLSWLPEAQVQLPPAPPPAAPQPPEPAPAPHPVPAVPSAVAKPLPPKPSAPPPAKAAPAAETSGWDPAALMARFPPPQGALYTEVDSEEAHWLQLHGALILDARRSDSYQEGHLPGARSLPVWEDGLQEKIAGLKADAYLPILVYCAGGDCEDSKLLAQKLRLAGCRNLRIYTGGFPDWVAQGWPVERGAAR